MQPAHKITWSCCASPLSRHSGTSDRAQCSSNPKKPRNTAKRWRMWNIQLLFWAARGVQSSAASTEHRGAFCRGEDLKHLWTGKISPKRALEILSWPYKHLVQPAHPVSSSRTPEQHLHPTQIPGISFSVLLKEAKHLFIFVCQSISCVCESFRNSHGDTEAQKSLAFLPFLGKNLPPFFILQKNCFIISLVLNSSINLSLVRPNSLCCLWRFCWEMPH